MYCPECKTKVPDDYHFCSNCGATLARPQIHKPVCKKCGAPLYFDMEERVELCQKCIAKEPQQPKENDTQGPPGYLPRYWVGTLLNLFGWASLILGVFAFFETIIVNAPVALSVGVCVGSLFSCALWFGFAEIVRMLQNISKK